jgi:LSD1 subclass zinc finger protein
MLSPTRQSRESSAKLLAWCPEPESNRHGPIKVRRILSPLRLPISPPGQCVQEECGHAWPPVDCRALRRAQEYPKTCAKNVRCAICALAHERNNIGWRPGSESNRRTRLCRPLHDHSATWPSEANQRKLTCALPKKQNLGLPEVSFAVLERETRLELATPTLARSCSTN